jgi:methylthioribulose-1-phosphate dehydratase
MKFKKFNRDASNFLLSNREKIELSAICDLAKYLDARCAIPATSSNFSLRACDNSFFISRSGVHKRDLNPSRFVRVNLEGNALTSTSPKPSDETLLHAFVYKHFPKARVVAHSHAKEFESFKCPEKIFQGHELLKAFGFKNHETNFMLPVFKNTQDIQSLSFEVESFFKKNDNHKIGFMVENHGIYCFGESASQVQNYLEVFLHLA